MVTFLAIVHVIACIALIALVMIQDSKGGGVFTSQASSGSVLGATGATSLAQTMTKVLALIFAATCIGLSILAAHSQKSVVDSVVPSATTAAPAAAETTPVNATQPAAPAANETK